MVKYRKTQSAKTFKAKYGFMQKAIWGRGGIWSRGYFVSTVSVDEKTILAHVANQEKENKGQLQFELWPKAGNRRLRRRRVHFVSETNLHTGATEKKWE